MELIYIHIDKYRNFRNIDLPISGKFNVIYDEDNENILIEKNANYHNIYPNYILNVNAFVGKNSVGKTNLIDLIGMRIDDRKSNRREYEVRYKTTSSIGHLYPDDVEQEIRHASYFFVYYIGKNENSEDLFCFEGNNLSKFEYLVGNSIEDKDYFVGKDWFSFLCTHDEIKKKFHFESNVSIRNGEYEFINASTVRGDYRSEQDKWSILSIRDNYNNDIYGYNSFVPQDDYKITIPRRVTSLNSRLWVERIRTLMFFLKNNDEFSMYKDDKYFLNIDYKDSTYVSENIKALFDSAVTRVEKDFKYSCNILESFVKHLCGQFLSNDEVKVKRAKGMIDELFIIVNSFDEAYQYYKKIIEIVVGEEYKNEIFNYFESLYKLLKDKNSFVTKDGIKIVITSKINFEDIKPIIELTMDFDYKNITFYEKFPIVSDFFECELSNLSDGEMFYLGLFSSIYEQISNENFCGRKENIILLFDEPESRMHPELSRNFINNLIGFLGLFSKNIKFQIIVSTHSPFILSDILQSNITYLEKDNVGPFISEQKDLSTFGANIHDILKNGFFMNCTIGEFSKQKINAVIKSLNTENNCSISLSKEEIKFIIANVGEPILQTKLQSKFVEMYPEDNKESLLEHIRFIENMLHSSNDEDHMKTISELYKIAETLRDKGEENE